MNAQTEKMANADGESIKKSSSIGYAVNLVMDYGNGRQVTISGTLPLGATKEDFDAELDKLRLTTNRQSALVTLRDVENTVEMASKTVASLEHILKAYEDDMEREIQRLGSGEDAKHTRIKSQVENMRAQAAGYRQAKREEIMRAQADIDKGTALIARLKKEIGD